GEVIEGLSAVDESMLTGESVPVEVQEGTRRDKVRYPNPKSMAVSRDEAKTSTSGATRLSSTPRSHWRTSPNSTSLISAMDLPLIFEVRACSAKRVPPQSGQDTVQNR